MFAGRPGPRLVRGRRGNVRVRPGVESPGGGRFLGRPGRARRRRRRRRRLLLGDRRGGVRSRAQPAQNQSPAARREGRGSGRPWAPARGQIPGGPRGRTQAGHVVEGVRLRTCSPPPTCHHPIFNARPVRFRRRRRSEIVQQPSTPRERPLAFEQLRGSGAGGTVHEVVVDVVEPGGAREVDHLVRRGQPLGLAARAAVAARHAAFAAGPAASRADPRAGRYRGVDVLAVAVAETHAAEGDRHAPAAASWCTAVAD